MTTPVWRAGHSQAGLLQLLQISLSKSAVTNSLDLLTTLTRGSKNTQYPETADDGNYLCTAGHVFIAL